MLIQATARTSDSMGTRMVVQRLTIRAAKGRLKVVPVWRCLTQSGVKVIRWNVSADRHDGMDSMTVDLVGTDARHTKEIADVLGKAPLEMTVTVISLTVISTPDIASEAGHDAERHAVDPLRTCLPHPRLTVPGNTTNHLLPVTRD